jgi:phenylpropionate dioxygenase-like ring-hydroxylating dioxygenase large terminal subunit
MLRAPPAERFPRCPASWYLFGPARALRHGPVSRTVLGRHLVAFRTAAGRVAVLDGRCAHLGTDLGAGCVVDETLRCPFHQWRYDADGCCVHIPASADIPPFARLRRYPAAERHGFVFFFNGPRPLFPLPFFPGADPNEFRAAAPFEAVLRCPWWMVGANVFDVQHFRAAHDRKLQGEPIVECPSLFARRIAATFVVEGDTLRDHVVRRLAGDRVRMSFTDWCGNIIFATPTFRRTTSYGMLITEPLGPNAVRVHGLVFVRRSRDPVRRLLFDPLHAAVRRYFIRAFLQSDARLATRGLRYHPEGLLDCDGELIRYFDWLASVPDEIPEDSGAYSLVAAEIVGERPRP